MRDILNDIVRQTHSLFPKVKITGTDDQTKIQAVDADKLMFLQAFLKQPAPELNGEFGIANITLLNGLLSFASYKAEGSAFKVGRKVLGGTETVYQFEFKDPQGAGATFKTIDPKAAGDQAQIAKIDWDVSIVPAKAKVAEFAQLAGLYSKVDNRFGVKMVDSNLVLNIGQSGELTHTASVVFAADVAGTIRTEMAHDSFSMANFLAILRLAGDNPTKVNITSKGVMGITVDTEFGIYDYYIRAKR